MIWITAEDVVRCKILCKRKSTKSRMVLRKQGKLGGRSPSRLQVPVDRVVYAPLAA